MSGKQVFFPPFTLDTSNQCLQRGSVKISLRPKTFGVLAHLVEHPHRLVSKEELMAAVWPGAKVVDAALRVSIQEIRKALGDGSAESKFIETVGKKGYRFIAPVSLRLPEAGRESFLPFVGRSTELDQLRHHLVIASGGKRQVVFVTGEPGIGKTTLVEAFTNGLPSNDGIITAHGQCIEQYGAGEAYMPILDALERLCNGPNKQQSVKLLHQCAPSWLASLPNTIDPTERHELDQQIVGITPERKFREIAGFFESISKDRILLLILEDLHWLDPSTLALISFLARRREAARLLLVGTYRDGEVESQKLPLKQMKEELELHHHCNHLPLKLLSRDAVGEYLAARFEAPHVSNTVTNTVYRRSEGNPLFMVGVTDYLVAREAISRHNGSVELGEDIGKETTPTTIRQLIERQFESLAREDQELLEVASVRGVSFSASILAAVLKKPLEEVEKQCDKLVEREHFLQHIRKNRWPDGTVSSQYSFIHALYENVIYDRVGESRKARLHRIIGARLEVGYKDTTEEIAAALASHFERGGDFERTLKYLLQAARKAFAACAYSETIDCATKGLKLIGGPEFHGTRDEVELSFQLLLGLAYAGAKGFAAAEAKEAFSKASVLSPLICNDHLVFRSLFGLWIFHTVHNDLRLAREIGQQMIEVAGRSRAVELLTIASMSVGITDFYMGNFSRARINLDRGSAFDHSKDSAAAATICGWNPFLSLSAYKAHALLFLGYPAQADREIEDALTLSNKDSTPYNQSLTFGLIATYFTYGLQPQRSLEFSEKTLTIANEAGFSHWSALATILKGSAICQLCDAEAGIELIRDGIRRWKATGADKTKPVFYGFEAHGWLKANNLRRARIVLDQGLALSQVTRDSYYDAELWLLQGEACTNPTGREENFQNAIALARRQEAKLLELRATTSLCRLWQRQGERKQAHRALTKIYNWFKEGFDTPDLKNAKALLDKLS